MNMWNFKVNVNPNIIQQLFRDWRETKDFLPWPDYYVFVSSLCQNKYSGPLIS